MSLRLELLQVARLAPRALEDAAPLVADFFTSQFTESGGVRNRAGDPDLYYTVFGMEGLIALQHEPPYERIASFLDTFGEGESLDVVHLGSLARCWAAMPKERRDPALVGRLVERIETYRSQDGSYWAEPNAPKGSVYHAFLALGVYQDVGATMPHPERILDCLKELRSDDGGFANDADIPVGSVPATAAAVALYRQLGEKPPHGVAEWLLSQLHPEGGFKAIPQAPMPDLLSTAVALHALVSMHTELGGVRDHCLDYLDSLWTGRGFCGNWADDDVDVEYTFYALLALGHLSLEA